MSLDKGIFVKKTIIFILSLFLLFIFFKLAIFYIPFIIAFLLSLLIEPIIKFLMKKMNFSRRASAIIVFVVALTLIISLLIWGVTTLISETSNLLGKINEYFSMAQGLIETLSNKINWEKIQLSNQVVETIKQTALDLLGNISTWSKEILSSTVNGIKNIPEVGICVLITLLALYFIVTDKIYILDQLESYIPKRWMHKLVKNIKELSKYLGRYLKAQFLMVLISFSISIVGLYVLKILGLNIKYPLLVALGIGFVDLLPIFGSGTVMLPWAAISALYGDYKLAICILVLWIIMSIVRQLLEPKIVSGKLGIHPIFTLVAMYTGFKFFGIIGLLLGPIILIILKNIYLPIAIEIAKI